MAALWRECEIMETVFQDVRYGLRQLRKSPGFAAVAILSLALGIGANTAMFSVIHAVLLKPLEYREPDRIVLVTEGATPIHAEELMAASRSYTELGVFAGGLEEVALSGVGEPEVLKAARVSANFLHILGVSPLRGRSFLPEEDKAGAPGVGMISAELWRRRFGRDPSIVGKTVTLAGMPHTIVGVLPAGFQFPISGADVWVTRPSEWSVISPQSRPLSPILSVFGRLQPYLDIEQASSELAVLNRQYAKAHPGMLDAKPNSTDPVRSLKDELVSDVRPKLWMLFGAVGFVLLIVCANLAGLLLARASSRSREFAVRAAIGAGRGRIVRQLIVESILLALVGGTLGVALAALSLSTFRSITFVDLPRTGEIRIDGTVFGFAVALSILTVVLFGLVPSLAASRPDLAGVLRGSGEGAGATGSKPTLRFGPRGLLVVGQVALSVVLLIGATLLIESLAQLYRVDPGFQSANLLTMQIALSPTRYDTDGKRAAFYEELVKRAESLPGIRSAAVTLTLPMTDRWFGVPLGVTGRPPAKLNERPIGVIENITPEYFRTLEIALRRGREFTEHDNADSARVAIISEGLARVLWPQYPSGPDPLGQHILIGTDPQPAEIVGISADVRQTGLDQNPKPGVYLPCIQKAPQSAMLALRTNGDPLSFANAVRGQVLAMDSDQPVSAIATMDNLIEASEGQLRLMMRLLGTFAGAAALLAVIGLYGVISYSVVQRTKEMGIRRALGAQGSDILSLVAGQVVGLALAGVFLGTCGAFALTRVLEDLLFQVRATDPATFAGISILFVLVALAASYVPARRATKVDPIVALRYE
jgi:putative ABC transport system permease protein